jgi:DNA sulfur modification protein DndC
MRRNGTHSPGPFTLETRLEIRNRLRELKREVGTTLLPEDENEQIEEFWKMDSDAEQFAMGLCGAREA